MGIIKELNRNIKSSDGGSIHGSAQYKESGNTAIKSDISGIGREYVRSSLDSSVKHEVKSYNYASSAAMNTEDKSRSKSASGERREHLSSTQQRIYSAPEQTAGSQNLSGAATSAIYVSKTDRIIKDDTKGVGREFVRGSLEGAIRNNLIKNNRQALGDNKVIAINETERAIARAKAARLRKSSHNKSSGGDLGAASGSEAFKHASQAKGYMTAIESSKNKKKKLISKISDRAYSGLVNATAYAGQDGSVSERTGGQSLKYIIRAPRYVKSAGKAIKHTGVSIKYGSRLLIDVKSGALTGKEAGLAALKRGGITLKGLGKTTAVSLGKTITEFNGSDDLGIEAVKKPRDMIVNTRRTLKIASRATKSIAQTPQQIKRTLRSIQKAAQKTAQRTKQAVKFAAHGIKAIGKLLANPIVLKCIAIVAVAILVVMVLLAGISSIVSIFSSQTYSASDEDLTDTYAYITELDTNLEKEIKEIPSKSEWSNIDEFHIYAFPPLTDPMPIISYLTVKYDDFKFNNAIKSEVDAIHAEMYQLSYNEWVEEIEHTGTTQNPDGTTSPYSWTESIYHLDVHLNCIPWPTYVMMHKEEMFLKSDDYERYQMYNTIGGTTLRSELGFPFIGEKVYISSRFGYRIHPISGDKSFHSGIDIPMPAGTPINAAMSGRVTTGSDSGYGNYVIITAGNRKSLYAHCQSVLVSNGQEVTKGHEIATVGSTGASTGNHLHLEFEKDGKKLNPFFYIEREQFALGVSGGVAGAAATDEQFAAIITEAEKYLGYPYVFGGKTPYTSFDCSGFVSWVYTYSGTKSISADAQGLFNNCSPVTEEEIKPGDLIFFQGTYNTPNTVTHVGIYVGNGMMLHCGNPIGYASFNTSYWQSHFYAYGRFN